MLFINATLIFALGIMIEVVKIIIEIFQSRMTIITIPGMESHPQNAVVENLPQEYPIGV